MSYIKRISYICYMSFKKESQSAQKSRTATIRERVLKISLTFENLK